MFLGAGASKAAGLPLTEELLQHIWPREHDSVEPWAVQRTKQQWKSELQRTVQVLYPDGALPGFRPPVADFFTLLEVINRVHAGRERLPLSPDDLLRDLRGEIAMGLTSAVEARQRSVASIPHYQWLTKTQGRPQVIITSNWDTIVELAALKAGLTVHLRWPRSAVGERLATLEPNSIVLLKLHGSTDWGSGDDPLVWAESTTWRYERLEAPLRSGHQVRKTSRLGGESLLRYRSIDAPIAKDRSRVGFGSPLMATMAAGKETFIQGFVAEIWDDAYWALWRAKRLDVIGYSFPLDDLELRTLLRLTTRQPKKSTLSEGLELSICNPAPETHERARALLGEGLSASYEGAASWKP